MRELPNPCIAQVECAPEEKEQPAEDRMRMEAQAAVAGMGGMAGLAMLPGMQTPLVPGMQAPMQRLAEAGEAVHKMHAELDRRFPGAGCSPELIARAEALKVQKEVEAQTKKAEPVQADPPKKAEPQSIQLDQVTLLKFELLATKQRLVKSEEQNLLLLVQDNKKQMKELQIQETRLIMETLNKAGINPEGRSIRLVDREKGLCAIE